MTSLQNMIENIVFDKWQQEAFNELLLLKQANLSQKNIINIFSFKKFPKNIYLYGPVGRGKSMIMKNFYSQIHKDKKYFHFAEFMIEIHKSLKIERENNKSNPLSKIIKRISNKTKLLCLDEFEIKDITDAMIMELVLSYLDQYKVCVILTSNTKPTDLYKEGLQKERFKKTIKFIEENYKIISLESPKDYRIGNITSENCYFLGDKGAIYLQNLRENFSKNIFYTEKILIFSREINVSLSFILNLESNKKINGAYFTFDELCKANLGSADYLAISKKFKIIMIENIPIMEADQRNEALRFIKLIDILYDNKNLIFCNAYAEPEHLYGYTDNSFEFKRTISRLTEMRSKSYIGSIINL